MKVKILLLIALFLIPSASLAQNAFKAEVIEVGEQKIKLKGLDSEFKDKEITSDISGYDILSMPDYKVGDIVMVDYNHDADGNDIFYVLDFVRANSLYWLAIIFAIIVILVGKLKGVRALIVLGLTFLVILKFIIPKILDGSNPLFISIIGSIIILALAIYITEGFKRKSTIAIFAILISLIITGLFSLWFTSFARLTGFASEEAAFLIDIANVAINIKGLLLAGIIIGTLGVLDDVVVSQVSLVQQMKESNKNMSKKEVYKKAMKVGISHLSSMVNTLFLAYAGVALPLLILFTIHSESSGLSEIINNEMVATEIVRTLTGSIGLVLAVPISTFFASEFIEVKS